MEMEAGFAEYYCADNGRLSVPIRKMVREIGKMRKKMMMGWWGGCC
jgi:hypothetical protein